MTMFAISQNGMQPGTTENPLLRLKALGQSVWLDFISRNLLTSGKLRCLIDEDGLSGITSNPSIFEQAIANSNDYDSDIASLIMLNKNSEQIYRSLIIRDIQNAADLLKPVYEQSKGTDGFVSLEVSPHLARDTAATVAEARQLWAMTNRPNVMIKVPATRAGLPAITRLISEGININVTLLFSLARYREVASAYIEGLEALAAQAKPMDRTISVASFFLSRIDVLVDLLLKKIIETQPHHAALANPLLGHTAIASAKLAYQRYKALFSSQRFLNLKARGANTQKLLWASTGTKNPAYSDVKYVEALIGPQTVNTFPMETLNAYRDHGNPDMRLEEGVSDAAHVLESLYKIGIDLDHITQQLEEDGIRKFREAYDSLLRHLSAVKNRQ